MNQAQFNHNEYAATEISQIYLLKKKQSESFY